MSQIKGENNRQTYTCPRCGYKQNFDEAYADSGKYCPSCDYPTDIPLEYWGKR